MATPLSTFTSGLYASVKHTFNYTSGVGAVLCLANAALLLNVILVISGTMADSAEFVSALNESLVIEPFVIAFANHTLSQFMVPTIALVLSGLLVKAIAIARAPITKIRRSVSYPCPTFPQPFVQKLGSRAPPVFN